MSSQTLDHTGLSKLWRLHPQRLAVIAVLFVAAALSASIAIKEALVGGIDFQWSAAHLLGARRDPWLTYLSGDKGHDIILGQQPNYLPELYELLLPLGAMPFSHALVWWCGINLLLLGATVAMVCRLYKLNRFQTALAALLMLASTPFRVTMSNGQHGIFILFLVTLLYYLANTVTRGFALGLSYSKYSFSPLFVLVTLMRKRWGIFLLSLVPPVVGLLIAWGMLGGNLVTLALEPLKTSKIAMGPGEADIMTSAEQAVRLAHVSPGLVYLLPALLGLGAAIVAAFAISRFRFDNGTEYALVMVFTLFCFKHGLYDYVVLLVPLAYLLSAAASNARRLGLLAVGYFWFACSIVNRARPGLHIDTSLLHLAVLCVLCASVVLTARRGSAFPTQARPELL